MNYNINNKKIISFNISEFEKFLFYNLKKKFFFIL